MKKYKIGIYGSAAGVEEKAVVKAKQSFQPDGLGCFNPSG